MRKDTTNNTQKKQKNQNIKPAQTKNTEFNIESQAILIYIIN